MGNLSEAPGREASEEAFAVVFTGGSRLGPTDRAEKLFRFRETQNKQCEQGCCGQHKVELIATAGPEQSMAMVEAELRKWRGYRLFPEDWQIALCDFNAALSRSALTLKGLVPRFFLVVPINNHLHSGRSLQLPMGLMYFIVCCSSVPFVILGFSWLLVVPLQ